MTMHTLEASAGDPSPVRAPVACFFAVVAPGSNRHRESLVVCADTNAVTVGEADFAFQSPGWTWSSALEALAHRARDDGERFAVVSAWVHAEWMAPRDELSPVFQDDARVDAPPDQAARSRRFAALYKRFQSYRLGHDWDGPYDRAFEGLLQQWAERYRAPWKSDAHALEAGARMRRFLETRFGEACNDSSGARPLDARGLWASFLASAPLGVGAVADVGAFERALSLFPVVHTTGDEYGWAPRAHEPWSRIAPRIQHGTRILYFPCTTAAPTCPESYDELVVAAKVHGFRVACMWTVSTSKKSLLSPVEPNPTPCQQALQVLLAVASEARNTDEDTFIRAQAPRFHRFCGHGVKLRRAGSGVGQRACAQGQPAPPALRRSLGTVPEAAPSSKRQRQTLLELAPPTPTPAPDKGKHKNAQHPKKATGAPKPKPKPAATGPALAHTATATATAVATAVSRALALPAPHTAAKTAALALFEFLGKVPPRNRVSLADMVRCRMAPSALERGDTCVASLVLAAIAGQHDPLCNYVAPHNGPVMTTDGAAECCAIIKDMHETTRLCSVQMLGIG